MPSDINALMGMASGDEGKMAAMAELLRRQQAGASIMALSPDKQVNALGTSQLKSVGAGAQRQGLMNRQAITADALRGQQDRQAAATQGYRDQQQSNWQAAKDYKAGTMAKPQQVWDVKTGKPAGQVARLGQTGWIDPTTQEAKDMTGLTLKDPYRKAAGRGRFGRGAAPDTFARPTAKQQKELQDLGIQSEKIDSLVAAYKPDYASGNLPIGEIQNYFARELPGVATQGMKDQQAWWAQFKNQYELATRHALFGSALTDTEKVEWRNATVNPNMEDPQVRRQMELLQKVQRFEARNMGKNALTKGWDKNWIDGNLGKWMAEDGATDTLTELPPPEGIDPAEWATFSPDQQQRISDAE